MARMRAQLARVPARVARPPDCAALPVARATRLHQEKRAFERTHEGIRYVMCS